MKLPVKIFNNMKYVIKDCENNLIGYWRTEKTDQFSTEYICRDVVRHCVKELVYGYRGDCPDDESANGMIDHAIESFNKTKGVAK